MSDEGIPWVVKSFAVLIGSIVLAGIYHNGCRTFGEEPASKGSKAEKAKHDVLAEVNSVKLVGLPFELRLEPGKWTKTWIKFPIVPYVMEVFDAPGGVEILFSAGARTTLYEKGQVDKETGIVYDLKPSFDGLGTTFKAFAKEGGVVKIRQKSAKETKGPAWKK